MQDINSVTLVCRLTRDAEITYSNTGFPFGRISVASNYSKKQGDGWIEEVSFFDLKLFGKICEGLQPYLLKGKQVAILGRLRQERWEKDGMKHSKVLVEVQDIELLGGKEGQSTTSTQESHYNAPQRQEKTSQSNYQGSQQGQKAKNW